MTPGRIITASLALAAGLGIGTETSGAPPPDAPAFPFIEKVLSASTGDLGKHNGPGASGFRKITAHTPGTEPNHGCSSAI